jgi:hypothetical protein
VQRTRGVTRRRDEGRGWLIEKCDRQKRMFDRAESAAGRNALSGARYALFTREQPSGVPRAHFPNDPISGEESECSECRSSPMRRQSAAKIPLAGLSLRNSVSLEPFQQRGITERSNFHCLPRVGYVTTSASRGRIDRRLSFRQDVSLQDDVVR